MRARVSPQLRFLIRGSGLLFAMLALWWWVLLGPLLIGMRLSTDAALWLLPGGRSASGVTVEPDGGWRIRVPLPAWLAKQDEVQKAFGRVPGGPPVAVRSFSLAVAERVPKFFTLGLPLFWAIVLAAPRASRPWRAAAIGTGVLAVIGLLSLLLYTAYSIESTLHLFRSTVVLTVWNAVEYLNLNVVPYAAPLVIAVWLHDGLRAQIFSWTTTPAAEGAAVEVKKAGRGRYRAR